MNGRSRAAAATAPAIGGLYFAYCCVLGVYQPYLAMVLAERGASPRATVYLLATLPIVSMLALPVWSLLADRLQSVGLVLRITHVGAFVALALVEVRVPFAGLAAFLVAFTVFRAPGPSLLDTLGLAYARDSGGDFGRIRAWGTVGYMLAALAVGALIERRGAGAAVHAIVAILAVSVALTFVLRVEARPDRAPLLPAIRALARRPRFVALIGTAALHQLGEATYETLYPSYLARLAGGTYAGAAVAFGAAAEVAFLMFARSLVGRWAPERVLVLSYAVSSVRWVLLATVREPHLLVLIQGLNAFTFGAFYLAAVTVVDEESPAPVRASAQGLFGALTWGLARSLALVVAGALQSGGRELPVVFFAASAASAVGTIIALRASRWPRPLARLD